MRRKVKTLFLYRNNPCKKNDTHPCTNSKILTPKKDFKPNLCCFTLLLVPSHNQKRQILADTYLTLAAPSEGTYTEKRSRFLAFALHVESEEEVKAHIAGFRKKFYDARHVCYAYTLGNNAERSRANDDGEPSGSAGKPILGQITSFGLTNTLVIVVRYFGGVKLGTGGLFSAYKIAAAEALQCAQIEERIVMTRFTVAASYADADTAMRYIR